MERTTFAPTPDGFGAFCDEVTRVDEGGEPNPDVMLAFQVATATAPFSVSHAELAIRAFVLLTSSDWSHTPR